jgi:membrane-bound ClpP family serine protease
MPAHGKGFRAALGAFLLLLASFSLQGAQDGRDSAAGGQPSAPAAIPAARQAKNVAIITIRGEIDAVTEKSVKRRIKLAETEGADAIVIELDTPGGEVGAVLEICDAIKRSSITNTVAWVNPDAYSGGAIIALACREIVCSDNATLGDALPIMGGLFGIINGLPDAERQKVLVPLLVEVVDSARRNGYDEKLVQGIVSRGVELWLVENAQTGERLFIGRDEYKLLFGQDPPPGETPAIPSAAGGASATQPTPGIPVRPTGEGGETIAGGAPASGGLFGQPAAVDSEKEIRPATPSITPEMASEISENLDRSSTRPRLTAKDRGQWRMIQYVSDGQGLIVVRTADMKRFGLAVKTINTDQELKDFFGATNMQRLNRSWSEALVVAMTNLIVRAVLIVIFLLGLFIEMTHPGLMLPGAVAMLALVLLIVPPFLNDMAAWWEILAIAAGLLLVAAEIFLIPGTGFAGVLGMILLFAGLVGTFVGGGSGLFPDSPERQSDLLWGAVTVLLSLAVSGVLMYFFARHFGSMPLVGRLVLQDTDPEAGGGLLAAMASPVLGPVAPGEEGVAITPLRPSGRVQFEQDVLDASADFDYVDAGSRVRVVRVEGLRIVVEAVRGDEANPGAGNADQSQEA